MTISPVTDLNMYGGYIRVVSDSSTIKRVSEVSSLINSGTIDNAISEDKNGGITADAYENKNNITSYDYRYLSSVPLSGTSNADKPFNETQKTKEKGNGQKSFSDYYEASDEQEEAPAKETTGKGYYIVLSDMTPQPEKKTSFTADELVTERIKSTYRLTRMNANGALVNLVF